MKNKKHIIIGLAGAMLLLAACDGGRDADTAPGDAPREIRFSVNAMQVAEATRAATYDSNEALTAEATFRAAAYENGTTIAYISETTVNYDAGTAKWTFSDDTHYWPPTDRLDFFAYMPVALPAYITAVSYPSAGTAQLTCADMPMTATAQAAEGLKEFIWAQATAKDKDSYGDGIVPLTFQHPFARICLKWATATPDAKVTVNEIRLKGLKTGGTCSLSGGTSAWSGLTGSSNFTVTSFDAMDGPYTRYLVIPQTFSGDIEVDATWTDWGETMKHTLSATLTTPTVWQPGHSYTYSFTVTKTALIVKTDTYTEQW